MLHLQLELWREFWKILPITKPTSTRIVKSRPVCVDKKNDPSIGAPFNVNGSIPRIAINNGQIVSDSLQKFSILPHTSKWLSKKTCFYLTHGEFFRKRWDLTNQRQTTRSHALKGRTFDLWHCTKSPRPGNMGVKTLQLPNFAKWFQVNKCVKPIWNLKMPPLERKKLQNCKTIQLQITS